MEDNNKKNIKVIRTYTSDMAEAVRDNETSVIKIALAEKDKREQEEVYEKAKGTKFSKILLTFAGIILLALAIFGLYFLATHKKEMPEPSVDNMETFISYDSFAYINTTNQTTTATLLQDTNQKQQSALDVIRAFFLTKNKTGLIEVLNSKEFLSLIKANPPGTLTRSLSDKYLLGKYASSDTSAEDKSTLFLIFETNDYNQTYAAMLDWEKTMLRDLYELFDIVGITESNIYLNSWRDIVIDNKDARVLYGDTGQELIYYVFINKNNFIITNNLDSLKEVSRRLLIKNN
jgi:flagellar basal body-associated protein FliL